MIMTFFFFHFSAVLWQQQDETKNCHSKYASQEKKKREEEDWFQSFGTRAMMWICLSIFLNFAAQMLQNIRRKNETTAIPTATIRNELGAIRPKYFFSLCAHSSRHATWWREVKRKVGERKEKWHNIYDFIGVRKILAQSHGDWVEPIAHISRWKAEARPFIKFNISKHDVSLPLSVRVLTFCAKYEQQLHRWVDNLLNWMPFIKY